MILMSNCLSCGSIIITIIFMIPGSESVALKVADFVVRAFQTNNPKPTRKPPLNDAYVEDEDDESIASENRPHYEINEIPMTPFRQLVKLFGLQPNQISAVAVNALVFVAQMVSETKRHEDACVVKFNIKINDSRRTYINKYAHALSPEGIGRDIPS